MRLRLDEEAYQITRAIGVERARKYIWDTFRKRRFADLDNIDLEKYIRDHQNVVKTVSGSCDSADQGKV